MVNALIVLGVAVFVFGASGLVLLSTYRHSTLTLSHGAVATLPPLELLFALQITSAIGSSLALLTDVLMSVAWLIGVGPLVVATTHYDVLTVRPGTGVAGERAAVREIDEAIVTVEQNSPGRTLSRSTCSGSASATNRSPISSATSLRRSRTESR